MSDRALASPTTTDDATPDMLYAALAHARRGLAVFPLHTPRASGGCSCGTACKSPGKHPRTPNGLKAATVDHDQIRIWWTTWPDANIGILTGAASGLVVIDVDGDEGEESLRRLTEAAGPIPRTHTIKTGKGRQLYFRHPGRKVRNAAPVRRDFPGVDSRGDGGYVVAPPSLHYTGRRYNHDETSPTVFAEAPAYLIAFINDRPPSGGGALKLVVDNDRRTIADGSRNSALASLAGSLRAKGLGAAALEAALLEHNREHCRPPLDDDEVRQIARSISNYPPGSPNDVLRTLTDAGNAKRFAQRYAKTIRYVPEWGKWITWQQTHWGIDGAGAVIELAKAAVDAIYEEGNLLGDADLRVAVAKHAKSSASAARLKAMVELASSEGDLVVHASELDRHRGLLGVQNGTLNLSTGKLQPASSGDYITMLAPVSFDAQADCPTFRQFMLQIMGSNQELVDYLQRVFGYALSGYTSEQYLYFFYGTGANGKSTLLAVLRDLLGHRYYLTLPSEAIMVRPGKSGATPELARLPGARVVVTNEIEDGTWLAESLVKLLTGGDRIAARHLYQEIFEFEPQFKLVIAGNHKPVVRNDDYGIWRRIQLVPFEVTIPTDQRDPNLPDKLRSELPGVLNWALHGYHQWRTRGLSPPQAVTGAVETYRKEMDLFGQWLEECCDLNAELETTAMYAYACFKNWSGFNGSKGWTNARFGRKVKERFQSRRTADSTLYKGFGVKKDADIFWPRV